MNANQRILLRTAESMHSLLTQQETPASVLPEERWNELQKLIRQIHRCRVHGFQRARKLLEGDFKAELAALATVLDSQLAQLRRPSPKCASVRDIYEDLRALNDEFEEVLVDLEAGTISATTDPITLGGTELGPFEIRLEWRELAERSPYRVIALAPNPAGTNDAVTHPHVQDERLCEGEGRAAIEAALDQGRIGDFFLIVTRLLRTYAQGQAYVELSGWEGLVMQRLRRPYRRRRTLSLRALRGGTVRRVLIHVRVLRNGALLGVHQVLRCMRASVLRVVPDVLHAL